MRTHQRRDERQRRRQQGPGFWRRLAVAMDPGNPITRNFAASIAMDAPGPVNFVQFWLIWDSLYRDFKYVNDPIQYEYISPASATIEAGLMGDCDDCAVLTASLIDAIGGTARVVIGVASGLSHAYAEAYLGQKDWVDVVVIPQLLERYDLSQRFFCHVDILDGYWINMDVLGGQHPGSRLFDADIEEIAVYPDRSLSVIWRP